MNAGKEPRPPRVKRQKLTVRRTGVLAQPLSIGNSVKADSVFKNASNVGNTPFRVFDEATALVTVTSCAAVWCTDPTGSCLEKMQSTAVESKRRDTHHTGVIGISVSSSPPICENPRVNAMSLKNVRQLPAGLLQPMRVPKLFGLITLLGLDTPEFSQFAVEPSLSNLKGREGTVPSPPTACVRLDILHHECLNRKQPAQPAANAQLPLPPRLGARSQRPTGSVEARGAARGVAVTSGSSHDPAGFTWSLTQSTASA